MNLPPIVRFSQKEYLEDLQKGHLFMRNIAYYQQYDKTDTARSDPFDGSLPSFEYIPHPYEEKVIPGSGHFMRFNSFVTCFFRYHHIYNNLVVTSPEVSAELKTFGCEHALIINTNLFISALQSQYDNGVNIRWGDVSYFSESALHAELMKFLLPTQAKRTVFPFEFIKRDTFQQQQEFRVCVRQNTPDVNCFLNDLHQSYSEFSEETMNLVTNSTLTVNIGSIKEFSQIVPAEMILNYVVNLRALNIGY